MYKLHPIYCQKTTSMLKVRAFLPIKKMYSKTPNKNKKINKTRHRKINRYISHHTQNLKRIFITEKNYKNHVHCNPFVLNLNKHRYVMTVLVKITEPVLD